MAVKPDKPDARKGSRTVGPDRHQDDGHSGEVTVRRLFRSPLAVRVTLAVFVAIMVVEAFILFPSYRRQEQHLLEDLRRVGTQWLLAAEPAFAHSGDPSVYTAIVLRAPLIVGASVIGENGLPVATSGERLEGPIPTATSTDGAFRSVDNRRHEWIWTGEDSPIGLPVVLRMDSSGVAAELRAYVLRILGLIVILSAALTGATMIAMGTVVLKPLVALSNALAKGEDQDWRGRNAVHARRQDEIGGVYRATAKLLDQLGTARRDLEARVDSRTAELKEVNARLKDSEARFRDFADASSDFYWEMDENLRFTFLSDRFTEVTGVPHDRVLGKTQKESPIPGVDPNDWERHLKTMAEQKPFRNFVHSRTKPDGSLVHIAVSGMPVVDDRGRFNGYRGIGADITERMNAENELADKEALLRLSLDNMTDGIYVLDSELRYLTFNDRYTQLLGVSYDELQVGKPVRDVVLRLARDGFYGPGDPQVLTDERMALIASPEYAEIEVTTKTGQILLVRKAPLDDGGAVITLTDITERKYAEEALRESEERFRAVIDHSPAAIILKDQDGRYLLVNRTWHRWFNPTGEEIKGKTAHDVFPKDYADDVTARDREVMEQQSPMDLERETRLADGNLRNMRVYKFPIFGANQEVVGVGTIEADITDRRRAEIAIRESEERLQTVLDHMPATVFFRDVEGKFLLINRTYEETYGLDRASVIGRTLHDLFPKGDADRCAAITQDVIDSGRLIEREYTSEATDEELVFSTVMFPIHAGSGEVVGVGGVELDITERKKAEKALLESQLRMRSLIDNSPSEIVIKDTDLRYVQVNRIFEEHYNVKRADVVGKAVRDVLPKSMADAIEVQDGEVMKSGVAIEMELDALIHGEDRINLESKFPIPDDEGNVIGIGGIATDITERKRAEWELKKAKESADAANKAKDDLVAMVSHEIRTPMNGALGMARLLWETDLDNEQQDCVDAIISSGEALVRLVDDLLDVSKLEAGALELEAIPFMPTDLIDRVIGLMASRADEKSLKLIRNVDPGIPPVLIGDPYRLRQVLLNLISNAIKFTSKGSVTIDTTLAAGDGDTAVVRFSVTDTGQGIKAETQKKLFSPYSQGAVEVARKYGGTGLGLTICRRLAELMNSEIVLESKYRKGSTFRFDVPLAIDHVTDAVTLRESQSSPHLGRSVEDVPDRPLMILQVEDNATNRDVVEKILSRVGHTVVSVVDGAEAVKAIRQRDFDVVIMDRHMPRMNGIEATRRIRAMPPPVDAIPIIGVTAAAAEEEVNACLRAGMDLVLVKPLRTRDLRMTVARLAAPSAEHLVFPPDAKVLVIDDMEINRVVAGRQLDKLGIASDLEEKGERALERAMEGGYDAILVDISMPGMDGVEFTHRLRQWEADRGLRTPVIAMTGHTSADERARFLDAGMDDYLTKPVVLRDLGAILGRWLADPGAVTSTGTARAASVTQTEAHGDGPPIDMALLGEILGDDDEDQKLDWIDQFVGQFPPLLDALADAISEQDRAATRDAAHAAKSAATCAAAVPLAGALQVLENGAGSADWTDVAAMAASARAELDRVIEFRGGQLKPH